MSEFVISKTLVDKKILDEQIILNLDTGDYHTLNDSAAFIWSQIQAQSSIEETTNELAKEFQVDPSIAQSDVNEVILQFKNLGFIE